MQFTITQTDRPLVALLRTAGYVVIGRTGSGELNAVRSTGSGEYPRYHLYAREESQGYIFRLHFDQKKPTYSGMAHAHGGVYEGAGIQEEAGRLMVIFTTGGFHAPAA